MLRKSTSPKISKRVWFVFRWGFPVVYGLFFAFWGLAVRVIMDDFARVPTDPKQATIVCGICFVCGVVASFFFWRPWRTGGEE